ncbi:MAG: ACP S-malonyltransferase [Candidatus Acetothermia bacterium]
MSKWGFLFPGQGSQEVGMGKYYRDADLASSILDQVRAVAGSEILDLMWKGPSEVLAETINAQPAIFIDSYVKGRILLQNSMTPACLVGHSLGEYSALAVGGCLDFPQGLKLVKKRASLMAEVEAPGTMIAVLGLDIQGVESTLDSLTRPPTVANYNSPSQIVLAGSQERLERAARSLEEAGAKVVWLDVSGPFHSPAMNPAQRELAKFIEELPFQDPDFPVLSSVSGSLEKDGQRLKNLLKKQMTAPVKWVEYLAKLADSGVEKTVEVGPGTVLRDLSRRGFPDGEHYAFTEVNPVEI